ncbi:ABC1 kinase family protein [Protaetiibacter intestinalis]|uniref:AarF/ABC1/UbiB kinase family protein n=1 Tax=Protaetiibacter intestinalis TaxID=2419774 RepID=A0A387B6P3_9MICO|nr:AarF/UbiB family protein [Protaetiibacter intestinalis]AYF98023.1 AarF/ABC1/UbiB kinase family protein [Protaetiibacter intestinalis]
MPQPGGGPPAGAEGRHLRARYRRIMRFATRAFVQAWWFELVLPRVGLAGLAERGRARRLQRLARRFHGLAVDLGGLMIKVGQFLSSRLDVLPPEITKELEGLQDEVAAEPFDRIRAQTEAELGIPLDVAFVAFDPVPIAAASLGQAHRAQLSPGIAADVGFTDVVVKVQRPGIEEVVGVDLAALRRVGRWLARVRLVSSRVDAPALVEEFAATSLAEIDYLHEAGNAERFAADFADDPRVAAPVVVWDRTSLRVLTLSDVTAIKITDVTALAAAGIDPAAVAQELARATFQQIFVAGFFHADPHPGNIFVTPGESGTGGDWHLTFVDFGMMGEISDALRAGLREFILAVVARDGRALVTSLERLGVLLPGADTDELERVMSASFDRFGGMGVAELHDLDPRELEAFARQFGDTIRSLPFQLPENFLLLIRTISLISGVTSALNRDFNMWDAVDPFARAVLSRSGFDVRELGQRALGYATTLGRLPRRLDELATRIDRGQLAVRAPGVERRLASLERMLARLISAIVFAAMLFTGVLLVRADEVLGWFLMVAAVVPLGHVLLTFRRL